MGGMKRDLGGNLKQYWGQHWINALLLALAVSAGGSAILSGCQAPDASAVDAASSALKTGCQVNADQKASFLKPVGVPTLKVRVDDQFTDAQILAIKKAVDEWNIFSTRVAGRPYLEVTKNTVPDAVRSMDPHECSGGFGTPDAFYVVRQQSNSKWQTMGFSSNISAATVRCDDGSSVTEQVILVNTSVTDAVQLTSVALHELGHALGLDHSCADSFGKTDFKGCAGIPTTHAYRKAVMFPTLKKAHFDGDIPDIKETLQENDTARATCISMGESQ